ncbi:cytochrome P450 [Gymnopus androsaceus JB14]|uniref:Cytochrome P450 n=1 Tax=Gymnopus androsaceus JB14 TaxID=1447944 RepID=A0A6A4IDI3_9AGAR|nr:cytochrome P450 [Gymnopus androsaceus JB14]
MFHVVIFSFIPVALAIALQVLGQTFRHPLSRFPGPLLAKWTVFYRAYYDLCKNGGWLRQLEVLHTVYGRSFIALEQLHFNDARAYGEIYAPGSRFHKDPALYAFGATSSVFATQDPQDAAVMRNILAMFFSRRRVIRREAAIRDKIVELISRLKSFKRESGIAANLDNAFPSMVLDVLTALMFSQPFNMLSSPAFDHPFVRRMESSSLNLWIMKYLPSRNAPILGAFSRFMRSMNPLADVIIALSKLIKDEITSILNRVDLNDVRDRIENINEFSAAAAPESDETDIPFYPFFLEKIQEPTRKQASSTEKTNRLNLLNLRRLIDEGINIRFAGTDTIANACLVGVKYLLAHKDILARLVAELDEAWPADGEISCEELEKLPYLTAVIKESLRLSHGVVSPMGDAVIMGEVIPAGTTIGISATFVHLNPELFPEPTTFSPERWLKSSSSVDEKKDFGSEVNSDKYLVSFSRGPRSCVGIHLARFELYMLFGFLFRKLELTPTVEQDPNSSLYFDDFFTPLYTDDPLCVFTKERVG